MKQIEVSILGQSYMLGCPEGGDTLLLAAVKAVDREMTDIRSAGKVKARERIAVLAALNIAYKLERKPASVSDADVGALPVDVAALISRIDKALGEHGHLL